MRKKTSLILSCSVLTMLILFTAPAVQAPLLDVLIPEGFRPWTLAIDASNNVWVAANKWEGTPLVWAGYILVYNTTSGNFSTFALPTSNSGPILGITIDSNGDIWVSERDAHKIAKLSGETVTEYAIGSAEDPAYPVTVEANGTDIWIGCARTANNVIMKFIPSTQTLVNYTLPAQYSNSEIRDIKILNNTVWFTNARSNYIGELNPATSTFTFHGPLYSHALFLDIDSQGKVWFTENWGNRLGVYDPATSNMTEYFINSTVGRDSPYGIVVDGNDNVWFSENLLKRIGRFNPITETIIEFAVDSKPYDIVRDNVGSLWFIGAGSWKIGRLDPTNYVGKRKENGLQATVSSKSPVSVGKEFTIKVMIKNMAPETVTDITVSLRLGKKLTLTDGQLKMNIETLNAGKWTILEWQVMATKAGKHRAVLTANGLLMDGSSANAKAAWRIIATK